MNENDHINSIPIIKGIKIVFARVLEKVLNVLVSHGSPSALRPSVMQDWCCHKCV